MDIDALKAELGAETQADLAAKLGISESYLSDLGRGHRNLSLPLAARIERMTGRKGLVDAIVAKRTAA